LGQFVQLLLFGLHGSGKSTVAQQMRVIQLGSEERLVYRPIIHKIVINASKSLIRALETHLPPDHAERAQRIILQADNEIITTSTAIDIKTIWGNPAIRAAFNDQTKVQLPEYTQYFLNGIERITSSNYIPNDQDILQCPGNKETGVVEVNLEVSGVRFRLIDVAGKGDRRKWLPCFEDVKAIIFCVALNEYDVYEEGVNKMIAALDLFEQVCNDPWLDGAGTILLLTKKDLFEEKIQQVNITTAFPDYSGGRNYADATNFIVHQFQSRHSSTKACFPHITCSLDPNPPFSTIMFNCIKDLVLRNALTEAKIV